MTTRPDTDSDPEIAAEAEVWAYGPVTVQCVRAVPTELHEPLWQMYARAFEPLRTAAAARQVLYRDEYLAELDDPRIWKYLAYDGAGVPIGQASLTNDLSTLAWISPEYFAARYPEQSARSAVYYVGFACTDPESSHPKVLWHLVSSFTRRAVADAGLLCYDTCAFNDTGIAFSRRLSVWFSRMGARSVEQVDSQNYYVSLYGGAG